MKKVFVLALIMSILCTAQAGYIKRSIMASGLRNYTLAFDGNGDPIAAATTSSLIPGAQSIVIIRANATMTRVFNVFTNEVIEIRDFHYVNDNLYILCGAHGTRAFVATMNGTFANMQFMEYPEVSIFYSIWGGSPVALDYYVCGGKDGYGIIASVNRSTLDLTSLYRTEHWEYHKIILKENPRRFVVSGRNPECTRIGYTEFIPPAFPTNNYYWEQNTEPASLCVVGDNMLVNNQVILASSWQNAVTLSLVYFGAASPVPSSYYFTL